MPTSPRHLKSPYATSRSRSTLPYYRQLGSAAMQALCIAVAGALLMVVLWPSWLGEEWRYSTPLWAFVVLGIGWFLRQRRVLLRAKRASRQ